MNKNEFAKAIRHNMFGKRDSIDQAYEYADMVARGSDNPAAVWTAIMVVVNTISDQLETNVK